MITDGVRSARAIAKADLPLAVGPAMSASGGRVFVFIATLVASDGLKAGDISAACDVLQGTAGPVVDGVACEIAFATRHPSESCDPSTDGIDIIVQRVADRPRKLLVADMDSTMITVECIDELADYAGLKAEVSAVTERAMRGEIDFAGALRDRVALLAGMPETTIAECLHERVKLMGGAKALIQTFRANGGEAILVSGGFTHFTGPVAKAIGFDRAIANRLIVKDGVLTGEVEQPIVDSATKRAVLLEALNGRDPSISIAIGDGANDIPMIEAAGLGVAYHAKPKTEAAADACVRKGDLSVLLYAMGYARKDWISARGGSNDIHAL
jgi:phosphoserine phosphatase